VEGSERTAFPRELVAFVQQGARPVFDGAGPGHWDTKIRECGSLKFLYRDLGLPRSARAAGLPPVHRGVRRLLLAQHKVNNPATADVRAFRSAMGEYLLVRTPGVHQCVGQDRQAVERTILVDRGRESGHV
jgi:hypothetical protein